MRGYKAPLYLLPGEIRGSGSPSISFFPQCWPLLGEEVEAQPLQRAHGQK